MIRLEESPAHYDIKYITVAELLEQSLREGLRRQQADARRLLEGGAVRLGWKAGFGTAAAMAKLGTSGPLVGFLTESTLIPSGARVDVSGWDAPVLEPEVAVRLSADLEAGASSDRVEAAVVGVAAAIELVDLGAAGGDAGEMLAGNLFHRRVLLGDFFEPGDLERLADLRLDVLAAGRMDEREADPAVLLGDLAGVVAAMADLLDGSDDGLRTGDVIITGAAVKPLQLAGGESVEVRVGSSTCSVDIAGSDVNRRGG
jgi:2-oxo-3-hexenedioate decarboxylase